MGPLLRAPKSPADCVIASNSILNGMHDPASVESHGALPGRPGSNLPSTFMKSPG